MRRDYFAVVRDELQLRKRRREVMLRGNRSRRSRREAASRRVNMRDRRIKAMGRGLPARSQKCRPIDGFPSLVSSHYHVIDDHYRMRLGDR